MNKKQKRPVEKKILKEIAKSIDDKKGNDIKIIDLRKFDNVIADFFVIADAETNTQVKAIADYVQKTLSKNIPLKPWGVEGEGIADWILIDYGNIIVHVFRTPVREYYDLEGLWEDAETVRF
jgi:ribosome-associated protein